MAAKREPIHCKVCNHNMGRSRCRVIDGKYGVRCNNCKTVYEIIIKLPEAIYNSVEKLTHSRPTESESHGKQSREGAGQGDQ